MIRIEILQCRAQAASEMPSFHLHLRGPRNLRDHLDDVLRGAALLVLLVQVTDGAAPGLEDGADDRIGVLRLEAVPEDLEARESTPGNDAHPGRGAALEEPGLPRPLLER